MKLKFLVDQQLPPALASFLTHCGHDASHVRDLGLKSEKYTAIWEYALQNDYIVISKDQDFFDFACRQGDVGRLVWIRLGNCRNQPLLTVFENYLPQILNSLAEGGRIVELR